MVNLCHVKQQPARSIPNQQVRYDSHHVFTIQVHPETLLIVDPREASGRTSDIAATKSKGQRKIQLPVTAKADESGDDDGNHRIYPA